MRKKVLLVFTLTLLNLSLFAQSQRIYVLFNQFGRICTGVAEAGTFVLECPNLPVCSFDYNIRDGSITFRMTASYRESVIGEGLFNYMIDCAAATVDEFNDKLYCSRYNANENNK